MNSEPSIDCNNICSIDGTPNYEADRREELANCGEIKKEFRDNSIEIFKKNANYAAVALKGICNSKKKRPTINEGRYEDPTNKHHWDFDKDKNDWEKSELWESKGGSTNKKRRRKVRNTKKKRNRRSNKKK